MQEQTSKWPQGFAEGLDEEIMLLEDVDMALGSWTLIMMLIRKFNSEVTLCSAPLSLLIIKSHLRQD